MSDSKMALRGLFLTLALACGCHSTNQSDRNARVDLTLHPSPPVVGPNAVTLRLATADGWPIAGAQVRLEGNMNHAGMKPSLADMEEVQPGRYAAALEFTMGGDWFILVTATMPDGQKIERKIDVPGVRSP